MDDHPVPYTYDKAGDLLGIEAEAVRARARRGALRRGPRTNDNRPTVLLSPADIATIRAGIRPVRPEAGPETGPDSTGRPDERDRTIKALDGELAAMREALAHEREALQRERVRADAAVMDASRERDRAEGAMIRAAASEAEVKGLREALAEARRPFWRRWIG